MGKGYVVVGNLVPEVQLFFLEEQASGNRMDRRVTPSFIVEAACPVEKVKVVQVLLGSQPIQAADLKIRPLCISAMKQVTRQREHTKWHLL